MTARWSAALLAVVAAIVVAMPSAAVAGSMEHWSCGGAARQPANNDGWASVQRGVPGGTVWESCAGSGVLGASFTPNQNVPTNQWGLVWSYRPPADTTIARVHAWMGWTQPQIADYSASMGVVVYRDVEAYDGAHVLDQCQVFAGCTSVADGWRDYDLGGTGTAWIVSMGCGGSDGAGCQAGDRGNYRVGATRVTLVDNYAPTGQINGGTLTDPGERRGTETLAIAAADRGVGVSDLRVTIGEHVVRGWSTLDEFGGRCRASGGGYLWRVPCPLQTSKIVAVDTSAVPPGSHLMTVSVRDAAGNATDIGSRRVTIGGPVAPPAPPASSGPNGTPVRGAASALSTARFDGRRRTVVRRPRAGKLLIYSGRLRTSKGVPIAGAQIGVTSQLRFPGAAVEPLAPLVTDAKGRFRLELLADGSRRVTLSYAATHGGPTLRTRIIDARVPAQVDLISPGRARRGQATTLSGTVRAARISERGARVAIESYYRRRWRIVGTVRSDALGNFAWTRTFRFKGPYRFRARVRPGADVAASGGASAPQRLVIR